MIDLLRILVGPLLWLAGFSALYGLHGIGCANGWSEAVVAGGASLHRAALVAAWIALLALQVAVVLALRRGPFASAAPFVHWTSLTLGVVGLVATLWSLFPVAVLSSC